MCGIAGLFRKEAQVEESELTEMTSSLAHRGPDGSGVKMFETGGFGHRRLSIISPETGAQPMSGEDEKVWVTFNGEIYNYVELRSQLQAFGHRFRTNSDTEVLVHGYAQWGYGVAAKLHGMFSFAVADLRNKKVFVARDHFGIKPLFYYYDSKIFSFSSELQAFGKVRDIERSVNMCAVDQYLWLQYIPAPLTVWNSTFKLKPAHYLVYHFDGRIEEQVPYWNIDFSRKEKRSREEWMELCEKKIMDSVNAHLVSDVPFGAFLSGGIDSTLVVSYMSEIMRQPVKTFSIGFEEDAFNELGYASEVAAKFGTQHHTEIVRPDALAVLPGLVEHFGEPFGDSSAIPTYYVSRLAAKHVKMVLSGDGGDESFAGYHSYINWLKFQAVNYRSGFKKKIFPLVQKLFPSRYPPTDTLPGWMAHVQYMGNEERRSLWNADSAVFFSDQISEFVSLFADTHKFSLANKAQYMDMKTYLPYAILAKVDVTSMMHGLEVRTPLIDKEVWEFAATIPEEFNIGLQPDGREWRTKQLLKNILKRKFGDRFVDREKKGFAVPLSHWFSPGGDLFGMLNDYLLSSDSEVLHFFRRDRVEMLIREKKSRFLWLLLFLEEWLRKTKTKGKPVEFNMEKAAGENKSQP